MKFLGKKIAYNKLTSKIEDNLNSSKFRILNEKLYTINSEEALKYFTENKEDFEVYHKGFSSQVSKWPKNPNDLILKTLKKNDKYKHLIIADIGCGEAKIAQELVPLGYNIKSFDLVDANKYIIKADMNNLPLKNMEIDLAIFCLSLMNTNFPYFILEANRILKNKGKLVVAEISSRVLNFNKFLNVFKYLGFKLISKKDVEGYFFILTFTKIKNSNENDINKIKDNFLDILKPCIYKKR